MSPTLAIAPLIKHLTTGLFGHIEERIYCTALRGSSQMQNQFLSIVTKRFKSNWIQRHISDEFVRNSKVEGYRARSAYKLLEIISKFPQVNEAILRPNSIFADLGAAPGSWSQVLANKSHISSKIIAIDRLRFDPMNKVTAVQEDFSVITNERVKRALNISSHTSEPIFNLIISDMCVEMSGNAIIDNSRNSDLWNIALEFCIQHLKSEDHFIIKVFDSEELIRFRDKARTVFSAVQLFKPRSSRNVSSERYLICLGKQKYR